VGGAIYLSGVFVMSYNVWRTIRQGSVEVPEPEPLIDAPAAAVAGGR
jgi:cbb3-type cytochrome oxidase subunit 1